MNKRGFSLVSMLVTMALIAMLSVVFMYGSGVFQKGGPKSPRADGKGVTVPGLAEAAARDTVCRSNLEQIRSAIMVFQSSNDEHFPNSLDDIKFPAEVLEDPIGHEKYVYDPATGQVHCPHPGHEKY